MIVPFKVSEDEVRMSPNPAIGALALGGERIHLRSAALEMVTHAGVRNESEPLTIVVDDVAWIIPVSAIRATRFRDTTIMPGGKGFGFDPKRLGGT
ncbi:MAG: hypothetical protein ACYDCI_13590 [Candidatus Limnocylindrales bacterium]